MNKVRYDFKQRRNKKTKERESFVNRVFNSGIGKIILLGVSLLMILSVVRSFKQMGQKISLLKQAEHEVDELRIENLELSLEIEEASTTDHLEREARDRLNYGQENEVVFVISDELVEIGMQRVGDILNPESDIEEVSMWDEWVRFVVEGY
ncbi:septum formation initiator family protein [bacterium]|nr:septum formation initiator family protein [bacterium]